ncbi:hypothetical protein [Denitrobaculum tricleocarpae]|uniref:DUF4893 domain-containing protein n=1 Tax=Denitrobaculum tricleocarpae TaxID=2591009 RepID=A0A545TPS1_9PROT|nr:hypothetical protein [Denitrobaculum tricleocarpae]TQV79225.1 hypothetical protein FKG95_16330 [Denitrobaculum tricleocarpae]
MNQNVYVMHSAFPSKIAVAILALLWLSPAAAEISVTHPRHYATPPKRVTTQPAAIPHGKTRLPPIRPGVIFRSDESLGEGNWNLDKELSKLCRDGKFVQKRDRRYVAVLKGQIYGAATASRQTLSDPQGFAVPDNIYVFRSQGTTRCRVYHRGDRIEPG